MYLPKSRYKQIAVTPDQGITDTQTGEIYTGPAIVDFLGNIYKGSSPDKIVGELKPPDPPEKRDLVYHYIKPGEKDYEKGYYIRYFAKDLRTGKIFEVDKRSYDSFVESNKTFIGTLQIKWILVGTVEDYWIGAYKGSGIATQNHATIMEAEKEMPGIQEQILKNPGEFVRI